METVLCCSSPRRLGQEHLFSRLLQRVRAPWHLCLGKTRNMPETSLALQPNESTAQIAVPTPALLEALLEPLLGCPQVKRGSAQIPTKGKQLFEVSHLAFSLYLVPLK